MVVPVPPPTVSTTVPPSTTLPAPTSTSSSSSTSTSRSTTSTSTTTSSTTAPTLAPPTGVTRYLAPAPLGNDANAGTIGAPWRTFKRAIPALNPGDSLALHDGIYIDSLYMNCASGGNAKNGTQALPITVRAMNERKAHIHSDGTFPPFWQENCSWWRFNGLHASNTKYCGTQATGCTTEGNPTQDNGNVFYWENVRNIDNYRLLGHDPNVVENTHVYRTYLSADVLFEECEAYAGHRHHFSTRADVRVTYRRCYANSLHKYAKGTTGCTGSCDNHEWGDEAFNLYGSSDCLIENSISEYGAQGYQIHGEKNPLAPDGDKASDGTRSGGRRNRILGCISLDDNEVSFVAASRLVGGIYRDTKGNVVEDFLVVNSGGNGLFFRNSSGNVVRRATIVRGAHAAIQGKGSDYQGTTCATNPSKCSLTVADILLSGNASGISNVDGFPPITQTNVKTVTPTCLLRPTSGVGADLWSRYMDGEKTAQPLWNADGSFPCGAVVPNVNDGPRACRNVHLRLGVGCQ